MSVAAGSLDQHRSGIYRSGRNDLGAGAAGKPEGQPPLILSRKLMDPGELAQPPEQVGGRGFGHQHENEVPNDLGTAADIARADRAGDSGQPLQRSAEALGLVARVMR